MTDLVSAKYTFVCDPDECDTMIELTTSDGFGFPSGVTQLTCPCNRQMSYLGCTIQPNNERKEMETNTVPYSYDANTLFIVMMSASCKKKNTTTHAFC
jgi:hypothetical protein